MQPWTTWAKATAEADKPTVHPARRSTKTRRSDRSQNRQARLWKTEAGEVRQQSQSQMHASIKTDFLLSLPKLTTLGAHTHTHTHTFSHSRDACDAAQKTTVAPTSSRSPTRLPTPTSFKADTRCAPTIVPQSMCPNASNTHETKRAMASQKAGGYADDCCNNFGFPDTFLPLLATSLFPRKWHGYGLCT